MNRHCSLYNYHRSSYNEIRKQNTTQIQRNRQKSQLARALRMSVERPSLTGTSISPSLLRLGDTAEERVGICKRGSKEHDDVLFSAQYAAPRS